ncbi:MAG: hypothetical protein JWQ87_4082 [Candidatus Sulfotelmatobacter sp.]|nr:hypothetical protein [Candidatus Sulfotelmatobacter sp.]
MDVRRGRIRILRRREEERPIVLAQASVASGMIEKQKPTRPTEARLRL